MDRKHSNPDTNSWIDDRMAKLDPSPGWNPDADRAFEQLTQRKPALNSQWARLAMTATILAATVFVLVLLPWQRLWAPKPVVTAAAQAQSSPAGKPAEKVMESPAPKPPAERRQQAMVKSPPPTAQVSPDPQKSHVPDLPNNEAELSPYLQQLAQQREVAAQPSQTDVTQPKVIHQVVPGYTDEARQAKIQGIVEIVITINMDGTVRFESFKKTLGYGLDEKAREAIEQWTFTPGTKGGVPVATISTVSMNFSLK